MADDDLGYLTSLSDHPNRPGDVSNMNPAFSSRLAAAIRQARAAGLPVGLMSGYRSDTTTGSAYDAGGNSSHGYGLASDISGLDGPNGKITNQWAQIANANGLHNPYGVGNQAEFNHWQLPEQPLEQTPKLLASLKDARATGDWNNVWSAYNSGGGPSRVASATPNASPFALPANAPMGMRNNNPLNIKYAPGVAYEGLVGPSANTDQGDPQNVFKTPEAGWAAAYSLLNKKYGGGMTTPAAIIAGKGGWTPGNMQAATNVAKSAGIGVNDDIGFSDPGKAQRFMRALVQQEQGGASSAYTDAMIANAISGAPLPATAVASTTPATPGTSIAGITPDQSKALMGDLSQMDKAMGGKGIGGGTGGGTGGDEPQPQPMGPAPPIRNMSNPAAFAPAVWGNTLTSMQTPAQWSAQSPGQNPYAAAGGAPIGQQFGTQLGSMQQLQQMMAMMGNPYGDAGYG